MSLQTQLEIRQRAEEYSEMVDDLKKWEEEIKTKTKKSTLNNPPLAPIRSSHSVSTDKTKINSSSSSSPNISSSRIKSNDYRAWDQFDVEKALDDMDKVENLAGKTLEENDDAAKKIEKAQRYKEKGNAHFKSGNFERAIEYYTQCMKLDPLHPTYPINRAMAFMKKNDYNNAESDCTRGINLDKKNVKAWWRRGVARMELGKLEEAKKDLEHALVLQPKDTATLNSLNKVKEMLHSPDEKSKKRIIAITDVDEFSPSKFNFQHSSPLPLTQISKNENNKNTSFINEMNTNSSLSNLSPKIVPVTNIPIHKDVLKASAVPVNSMENDEVIKMEDPMLPTSVVKKQEASISKMRSIPSTFFDFDVEWKNLKKHPEELYSYLQRIPPKDYPCIFKDSLESEHLAAFMTMLHRKKESVDIDFLSKALYYLSKVKRFSVQLKFLNKHERQELRGIFSYLKTHEFKSEVSSLDELCQCYQVSV